VFKENPISVDLNGDGDITDDINLPTGSFTDLDGNARLLGSEVDRGPYEYVE
jgi:hypothetical protein